MHQMDYRSTAMSQGIALEEWSWWLKTNKEKQESSIKRSPILWLLCSQQSFGGRAGTLSPFTDKETFRVEQTILVPQPARGLVPPESVLLALFWAYKHPYTLRDLTPILELCKCLLSTFWKKCKDTSYILEIKENQKSISGGNSNFGFLCSWHKKQETGVCREHN